MEKMKKIDKLLARITKKKRDQKLLHWIRSRLFIFVFIFITLGGGSKKILLRFMSKSVLPLFSSKGFIVSSFTCRSLIYLEFIFVCGVKEYFNFILLHVAVQFSQHHLLEWEKILSNEATAKGLNLQNIQTAHAAKNEEKKKPNQNMGGRSK